LSYDSRRSQRGKERRTPLRVGIRKGKGRLHIDHGERGGGWEKEIELLASRQCRGKLSRGCGRVTDTEKKASPEEGEDEAAIVAIPSKGKLSAPLSAGKSSSPRKRKKGVGFARRIDDHRRNLGREFHRNGGHKRRKNTSSFPFPREKGRDPERKGVKEYHLPNHAH